ncbi:MAG: rubrerythrin [Candidatus Nanohaloarchaea archaeon]
MDKYDEVALVVTHPHEEFDEGVTYEELSKIVSDAEFDTYVVNSADVNSDPYHESEFDEILEEETAGQLSTEDAEELRQDYDQIMLGGGYIEMCAENTYKSLLEAGFEQEDVTVLPEISYDQSFPDKKYSVQEVLETGDLNTISDYISSGNNELVERAKLEGQFIEDVKEDIHRASEMTVEEAVREPELSLEIGFEATPGEKSRPKVGV